MSRDPKVSTIISWEEVPLLEHDMDAVAKQTAQLQQVRNSPSDDRATSPQLTGCFAQFMNLMNNDFVLLDEDGEVAGHYHDADVSGEEAIARESAEEGQDHAPKRKAGKPKQAVQRKRKPPPAKGAKKTAPKPRRQTKNAFVESDGDEELNLDDEPEPSSSSSEDSDA